MSGLTFTHNGREMSMERWIEAMAKDAHEQAMRKIEEDARGVASSIVDPETGRHPEVFVRRIDDKSFLLKTNGSAAFAKEMERRLGLADGAVQAAGTPRAETPVVYLAHAHGDKEDIVRPLARRLIENGVDVWLDEWEIQAGDSLKRRMEEGLGACTHFVVVLTPKSIDKPWVNEEIDAGFVRSVEGVSKFIPLRVGVGLDRLSPFLKAKLCPEYDPGGADDFERLRSTIFGLSLKPPLGAKPSFVATAPGLTGWSKAAVAVAGHLAKASKTGTAHDPMASAGDIASAISLTIEDVLDGAVDLKKAGMAEIRRYGSDRDALISPMPGLFVEFDGHFLGFDNRADAVAVLAWVVNSGAQGANTDELAKGFPDWPERRFNGALTYLNEADLVHTSAALGNRRPFVFFRLNDSSRRFIRENS
jgi:hypothetical protein